MLLKAVERHVGKNRAETEAFRVLKAWDLRMTRESAGAAVFGLFYHSLVEDLFFSKLGGAVYKGVTEYPPLASRMTRRVLLGKGRKWLEGATPDDVLLDSFKSAVRRGQIVMDDDPTKWKWGDIHRATFRHPLTSRSKFLELLYQVGPISMDGSWSTVGLSGWSQANPFATREGVSFMQIAETTQPRRVFAVGHMGASGHFFSGHYKDQTEAWTKGRLSKEPLLSSEIREKGFNTVLFKAAGVDKALRK
jgi:penicillin amidase